MAYIKRMFLIDNDDDDSFCFNLALDGLDDGVAINALLEKEGSIQRERRPCQLLIFYQ